MIGINLTFFALTLATVLVLLGNVIVFNLPASYHCNGVRDYVEGEQPQPTYAILGGASASQNNALLSLTSQYERDFCRGEYYVCRNRPVLCDGSVIAEVDRDRVTLSDFTAFRTSQSVSELVAELVAIGWGCLWNIGIFLWFVVNIPVLLSFVSWLGFCILLGTALVPITDAIASLERAAANGGLAKAPALSAIGNESALGDAALATAAQVDLALRRQPRNFADDMEFEE